MSRAKVLEYYNGCYKGSLTDEECATLDSIIELDKSNGCYSDLRHIIYELSDTDTDKVIDEMETYGRMFSEIKKTTGTLRDEQTLATAYAYCAGSCIIGDSVGFGKTPTVAGLCRILDNIARNNEKSFKYLLLTEKNLVDQTRFKMVKFTGDYVHSLYGDAVACNKFINWYPCGTGLEHSIVGAHSLFTQPLFIEWLEVCRTLGDGFPFDLLIVDESSVLGNSTTGITKKAKVLLKYFKRVIFLNATPFESKLDIFFTQLDLLDPKLLPTKTNFQQEYCIFDRRGMYPKPTGKYKNAELFKDLIKYRYFARTRREKGAVMEDCSGRLIVSELSAIQKEWLPKTQIPQMVYDCPNYFDSSIEFNEENVPKLRGVREALEVDFADADTMLFFVRYKECQASLSNWLWDMGYSNKILNGETKNTERWDTIRGFKNSEYNILITNVQKGLDFGNCNYCLFFGFDPNPNKMVQFEGRITRSFDIIDKHIILLCSKGKELSKLNQVIKPRAGASSKFAGSDISCIMSLLLDE